MKSIITENTRVPIKIWAPLESVEGEARQQLRNIASLPFVFKHVAAMPDVHLGKGATVGSVIATKNAICPAAVGVDIGCGMMAVKTGLDPSFCKDNIATIRHSIERSIPVGFHSNKRIEDSVASWAGWSDWAANPTHVKDKDLLQKATAQLGSLGGGNHFIELCTDEVGAVWVMLHSGSRNVGKTLASRHIDTAKGIMKRMFIDLPDPDLAYLVKDTPEYRAYMVDLHWAQEYAAQNRREMMARIAKDLEFATGEAVTCGLAVNCHHNYVATENHFGQNVMVTRKGAVRARKGDLGIIPGSMGTRSYIVRGLGNPESFDSCSHGAGRRMSRKEARRRFTVEDLKQQTQGVECRKDDGVLDEIPSSYKDIDEVMENQKDLVEIVATLKQFMCVKG